MHVTVFTYVYLYRVIYMHTSVKNLSCTHIGICIYIFIYIHMSKSL